MQEACRMMTAGSQFVCRTCLCVDNLVPIFPRSDLHERYTLALFLTTGLQIEMDDGLPQTICNDCIKLINTAIEFRNQSHKSERKLLRWGHKRSSVENMNTKLDPIEYNQELRRDSPSPHFEFDVEFVDRLKEEVSENLKASDWNAKNFDLPGEKLSTSVFIPDLSKKSMINKIDRDKMYENLTDRPMRGPGPYECKACKKILKNWSSFRTHAKIHVGFDFMCEYCGKKFIAVTMLQRHCMSQHGTERTYRCRLCDHRALDSERLKVHVRREHTGDRPYVCDTCGASFLVRRGLVHHLDVHRTQKTVQCERCPAKFKSAQHLHCHTSKVHRRLAWRAQCYLCDNSYTKCETVRKHLAKVHGVPRQQQAAVRRVRATYA